MQIGAIASECRVSARINSALLLRVVANTHVHEVRDLLQRLAGYFNIMVQLSFKNSAIETPESVDVFETQFLQTGSVIIDCLHEQWTICILKMCCVHLSPDDRQEYKALKEAFGTLTSFVEDWQISFLEDAADERLGLIGRIMDKLAGMIEEWLVL